MKLNAAQALISGHDLQRPALVCGTLAITYGELPVQVARAAAVWRDRGLEPGDRVAIQQPDGLDWVLAFLGTIWAGGVAVGVNPRIPDEDWRPMLAEAGFRHILANSADDVPAPYRDRVIDLTRWRSEVAAATPVAPRPLDPDQPAFWTMSSGTSGRSKAIVHGQRAVRAVERASVERLGLHAGDRLFASSRLFFCYPLANSLLAGLKIGATVVLDPAWPTPAGVIATLAAQRPTVFFSVPSFYRDLLREGLAPRLAALGVRLCVSAGEGLPAGLRAAWRAQTGLTIANGYGASETLTLALIDDAGDGGLCPSPGVRITPVDAAAAHDDAMPTPIHIRTPTLALGYWQRPDAQAQAFRDGGYAPADLFTGAATGRWHHAGREDALVKVHGRWVDLAELDERLTRCPGVSEAACVLVPDADGVDTIVLFYVPADTGAADIDDAVRRQVAGWPAHQRPSRINVSAALPRTATGKLLRRKLVALQTQADARRAAALDRMHR